MFYFVKIVVQTIVQCVLTLFSCSISIRERNLGPEPSYCWLVSDNTKRNLWPASTSNVQPGQEGERRPLHPLLHSTSTTADGYHRPGQPQPGDWGLFLSLYFGSLLDKNYLKITQYDNRLEVISYVYYLHFPVSIRIWILIKNLIIAK